MKYKGHFLFTTLIYYVLILVIGIIGTISYKNTPNINDNLNTNIIEENNANEFSLFEKGVEVTSIDKYNDSYIAYGSKDNYPYISILNNEQNEILTEAEYTENTGLITELNYDGIYFNTTISDKDYKETKDFFVSGKNVIPFHKKQLTFNYSKNVVMKPKYLVIHETANTSIGADANAHYRYWSTNSTANASTHFVVDSNEIYQMLELNQMAWHIGDNKSYSDIKNTNSIGIEICVNEDGDYMKARQHTIDLTISIMNKLGMTIDQLKIHQDASGKFDPIIMLNNNLWGDFVNQVAKGLNN